MHRWLRATVVLGGACSIAALVFVLTSFAASGRPHGATATSVCDRYASPTGKDRWTGTRTRPFISIPRLAASLRPGQVGCLLRGSYVDDQIIIRHGGSPGKPVIIRQAPGTRPVVHGRITIAADVTDLVIAGLALDGRNKIHGASPTILGDRITFQNDDITNFNTEICFILGSLTRGNLAEGVVINGNRIHNCGKLPPQNQDHGIYVQYARNTVIKNNYIYDNADRGIQLYPDGDGTLIQNNIIDGNGEGIIFSGDGTRTSDDNIVRDNVISNSRVRSNIEYFYPQGSAPGRGNVVTHNCVFGAAEEEVEGAGFAFSADATLVTDPMFVNRSAKDFRLQMASPCLSAAPKLTPPTALLQASASGSG
jgi:parallel beta-helix repeat protein